MKISCLSLCLISAMCWLYLTPTTGNKILQFGSCMISMNVNEIRASFRAIKATIQSKDAIRTISILSHPYSLNSVSCLIINQPRGGYICVKKACMELLDTLNGETEADKCCIIHHLLRFYVDKVFRHCDTGDSHVNRKISSIANSFLSIKKKFRQCNEKNVCDCGEEAIEKYKQILTNYGQLDVTSAAMKSLGELDILLDWMEKAH